VRFVNCLTVPANIRQKDHQKLDWAHSRPGRGIIGLADNESVCQHRVSFSGLLVSDTLEKTKKKARKEAEEKLKKARTVTIRAEQCSQ
jgi:hypothetical protein